MRWFSPILALGLLAAVLAIPTLFFRSQYDNLKRVRVVTPGKLVRCGQLSEDGLRQVIRDYGIKTVVNLQDEAPDPVLMLDGKPGKRESVVTQEEGAEYVLLRDFELLPINQLETGRRPHTIDDFLRIMDDPDKLPVLVHCMAGLHRTGALVAVYRMEYEGFSPQVAAAEMRNCGYGDRECTLANDYIYEYLEMYRPGLRMRSASAKLMLLGGLGSLVNSAEDDRP